MARANICLDFDGVLNVYRGWKGNDELCKPQPGLEDFLIELRRRGFGLVICSTRPAAKILAWLDKYELTHLIDNVVDRKPPAVAYIDDRAIQFNGDFAETLAALSGFKVYWEGR